jgi:Leucine-rich repeat (LRR) protein
MITVKYRDHSIKEFIYFNDLFDSNILNIYEINCSNNQISEIPSDIGELYNLHTLICSNNKIKSIPIEISKLYYLHTIDFSNNQISEIPEQLYELVNLRYFNCTNNKINIISSNIYKLTNLISFKYHDNPISEIPLEILNCKHLTDMSFNIDKIDDDHIILKILNTSDKIYKNNNTKYLNLKSIKFDLNTLSDYKNKLSDNQIKQYLINIYYKIYQDLVKIIYGINIGGSHMQYVVNILNKPMTDAEYMLYKSRALRVIFILEKFIPYIKYFLSDS